MALYPKFQENIDDNLLESNAFQADLEAITNIVNSVQREVDARKKTPLSSLVVSKVRPAGHRRLATMPY
jgi:hypothetical protein